MGGFFGVSSQSDCVTDLFYGTDYHSHLGTVRGGLATKGKSGFIRFIHDITNSQFKTKFEEDINHLQGQTGIGIISDYEDQPLIIGSHLGTFAIATVGVISNLEELSQKAFNKRTTHFSEMTGGYINPTELVATIIAEEATFVDGIKNAQEKIKGSCSILILTDHGIYAGRDKLGRTPIVIGKKDGAFAASSETCAFYNLGYETEKFLGPGEVVLVTPEGVEQKSAPLDKMQICAFLWVYYGYPASHYEGINVEAVRYKCGTCLARRETAAIDVVSGIPDSGTGHAIGYSNEARIPYARPFVKYTPTWPRSFMPQDQSRRDLVAKMKLIPIPELIKEKRILFCEDSIVRGTQLRDIIQRLYSYGAKEVHMRPACPPLVYGCKYLNFSRSRSEMDLAARRAIEKLVGNVNADLTRYTQSESGPYNEMIEMIRKELKLSSLKYQLLSDLIEAIGLPPEKVCTYCWDGREPS
ncbi:MAG: amidophosphoribosyltransferase [Spirochaetales bacterium]|nr:amidophosphoribosyltransferase [Spirochaetales bacterium]